MKVQATFEMSIDGEEDEQALLAADQMERSMHHIGQAAPGARLIVVKRETSYFTEVELPKAVEAV